MLDVLYGGAVVVFLLLVVAVRRARRRGASLRTGLIGSLYDWQNADKQRALEVIVEGRAAATDPETRDGDLPRLAGGGPQKGRRGADGH